MTRHYGIFCLMFLFLLAPTFIFSFRPIYTRRSFQLSATSASISTDATSSPSAEGVHLLDHLNINHEQGSHDLLCKFYFDTLGWRADPRKASNLDDGKGTVWANAGATQVHLSEGKPGPQVLDGSITINYPSMASLQALVLRAEEVRVDGT